MKLKIQKIYPDVITPYFATKGAAAFDICSYMPNNQYAQISNGDSVVIDTGLKVEIPEGYGLFIYSRSGHGFKNDVRLSNCVGVIDSDYRGEIKVKLYADFNGDPQPLFIKHGERIAQGVLMKLPKVEIVEVESLSDTERGENGFGSTS